MGRIQACIANCISLGISACAINNAPTQFLQRELVVSTHSDWLVVCDCVNVQKHAATVLGLLPGVDVVVCVEGLFGLEATDDLAAGLVHLIVLDDTAFGL